MSRPRRLPSRLPASQTPSSSGVVGSRRHRPGSLASLARTDSPVTPRSPESVYEFQPPPPAATASYQLSAISHQTSREPRAASRELRAASCELVVHSTHCHLKQLLPRLTSSRACSPRACRAPLDARARTDAPCRSSFREARSRKLSFPSWPTPPSIGRWWTCSGVMSGRSVLIMRIRITASPKSCCYRTRVRRARTECRPTILISTQLRAPTSANLSVCSEIGHASTWSCSVWDLMDMSARSFQVTPPSRKPHDWSWPSLIRPSRPHDG
jgi:hypothetical protein